jgi:hypothetical protein
MVQTSRSQGNTADGEGSNAGTSDREKTERSIGGRRRREKRL